MTLQGSNKIKDRVEFILQTFPSARNSDAKLIAYYLYQFHEDLVKKDREDYWIRLNDIADREKLPSFESIRRVRQKLQEMGQYPSDEQIARVRAMQAENVRTTINTNVWAENLP